MEPLTQSLTYDPPFAPEAIETLRGRFLAALSPVLDYDLEEPPAEADPAVHFFDLQQGHVQLRLIITRDRIKSKEYVHVSVTTAPELLPLHQITLMLDAVQSLSGRRRLAAYVATSARGVAHFFFPAIEILLDPSRN